MPRYRSGRYRTWPCRSRKPDLTRSAATLPALTACSACASTGTPEAHLFASCLPVGVTPSAPRIPDFGAQYPACIYPCPTLRVQPHDCPRMARGQDGSLRLSCMTLTFTTPRRFIPTLSAPEWVFTTHGANQLAHLFRYGRPPRLTVSHFPGPEQAEALPVPADNGRGFDDKDEFGGLDRS